MDLNMTVAQFWWLILGLGLVIVLVVAALLVAIILAARRIERAAADIWTVGKQIAGNTVQIWQLGETNATAKAIHGVALDIAGGAKSIDERLAKLPQVLGKG
ncbi:MAG TPA: hypothetical protein VFM06_02465 [Candidatus Limnocylindria bacterium]|nr:hypothetical protein [Candidatus Limnocylindria bacterium]